MGQQAKGDKYYKEIADDYVASRTKKSEWHLEHLILEQLLADQPDGITVLDLPFGTGRFVELYEAKAMKIYGLDISTDMVNAAEKNLGKLFDHCKVTVCDATKKLPYADQYFDLIVSFRFMKFFSYNISLEILREFYRILKPEAFAIIHMKLLKNNEPKTESDKELNSIGGKLYDQDAVELFNIAGFQVIHKAKVAGMERSKPATKKRSNTSIQNGSNSIPGKVIKHLQDGTLTRAIINRLNGKQKVKKPKHERIDYMVYILQR